METKLGQVLKDDGRTQVWLAKRLEVTPQVVNLWVKGKSNPSDKNKVRIAGLLGISVGELFFDENGGKRG